MILKSGARGPDVFKLQQGLAFLGYPSGPADGVFGQRTDNAVEAFQAAQKLYADGIVGPVTKAAYNKALRSAGGPKEWLLEDPKTPASKPKKLQRLPWVTCQADKIRGGFSSLQLRQDVALDYRTLYRAVHILGGCLTTAGGRRPLASKAGPNRSKTSMHYTGRAFDLAVPTGMADPDSDVFVITREEKPDDRYWEVWCRSRFSAKRVSELISQLNVNLSREGGPVTRLDAWYVERTKNAKGRNITVPRVKETRGVFFSFTELAFNYGFRRIRARSSFFKSGNLMGAEWWHFQWEKGLVRKQTTFGSELLRVYTPEEARKFVYWNEVKNFRYGVEWF